MSTSVSIVRVIEDFNNTIGKELKVLEKTVADIVEGCGATAETFDAQTTVCYLYFLLFTYILFAKSLQEEEKQREDNQKMVLLYFSLFF